jgi:hypothetical protein
VLQCGTTWTQELAWLILHEADTKEAEERYLFERSPFLEFPLVVGSSPEAVASFFDGLEAMPSPRLIKSHFPFELLPEGLVDTCKVIFVSRNVKDVVVSYFHHEKLLKLHGLLAGFENYARTIFRQSLTCFGGYFEMLESGWKRKESPNLLFLWYESMKEDQEVAIHKIAEHIGVKLSTEAVDKIASFGKFENYQKKSTLNRFESQWWNEGKGEFVRKGQVGDWVNHFTPELTAEYDAWIREELTRLDITDPEIVSYFQIQD